MTLKKIVTIFYRIRQFVTLQFSRLPDRGTSLPEEQSVPIITTEDDRIRVTDTRPFFSMHLEVSVESYSDRLKKLFSTFS